MHSFFYLAGKKKLLGIEQVKPVTVMK